MAYILCVLSNESFNYWTNFDGKQKPHSFYSRYEMIFYWTIIRRAASKFYWSIAAPTPKRQSVQVVGLSPLMVAVSGANNTRLLGIVYYRIIKQVGRRLLLGNSQFTIIKDISNFYLFSILLCIHVDKPGFFTALPRISSIRPNKRIYG